MSNPYSAPAADLTGPDAAAYQPEFMATKGRIGRLRFLAYGLGGTFAMAILVVIGGFTKFESVKIAITVVACIVMVALVFILARRRLHDMGHAEWWALLMLIPWLNLIFLCWLILAPGDAGSNRFGRPPSKNSTLDILGACAMSVIFIGVLAAVAIASYQDETAVEVKRQQQKQPDLGFP